MPWSVGAARPILTTCGLLNPRAIGLKVSDEFTVPLFRGHHRDLHQAGNEEIWWQRRQIDALKIATVLWNETHHL